MSTTNESVFSWASLIQEGISGKDRAIAAYDEMLWRIRTGYAVVLYGTFTLVVNFMDKSKLPISASKAAAIAFILITGFTVVAGALDFHFLRSKLRVVETKEHLVDIAFMLSIGGKLEDWKGIPLKHLLHNSGEHNIKIHWRHYSSALPIWLLYFGTWFPLCLASYIMVN